MGRPSTIDNHAPASALGYLGSLEYSGDKMTLGFAAAAWTETDERMVAVAADTRITFTDGRSDAGAKTYELGGPCAMVASGMRYRR